MIIPVCTSRKNCDRFFSERVTEMESTGKEPLETTCLEEGLRILARMIVRAQLSGSEHGSESKQEDGDVIDE
jgi:hypothetical protein